MIDIVTWALPHARLAFWLSQILAEPSAVGRRRRGIHVAIAWGATILTANGRFVILAELDQVITIRRWANDIVVDAPVAPQSVARSINDIGFCAETATAAGHVSGVGLNHTSELVVYDVFRKHIHELFRNGQLLIFGQ